MMFNYFYLIYEINHYKKIYQLKETIIVGPVEFYSRLIVHLLMLFL
jgi:hypothetical protein